MFSNLASHPLRAILLILASVCGAALLAGCVTTAKTQASYSPSGKFVSVDGIDMHYLDTGPAAGAENTQAPLTPIVLIHGASANLLDMEVALAGTLSKSRRVVIVDRPGHGFSGRPENGHNLVNQSSLIRGVVDALDLGKPIILGQSYGGAVALNYALEHPDALSGLMLIAPASHPWPGAGVDSYHKISTSPVLGGFFRNAIIPVFGKFRARDIIDSSFNPQTTPDGYFDAAGVELVFTPDIFYNNSKDLLAVYDELAAQSPRYSEINVPTRILAGTADRSVWPEIHAVPLSKTIPGAELLFVGGLGHPAHHEAQDEIEMLISQIDAQIRP